MKRFTLVALLILISTTLFSQKTKKQRSTVKVDETGKNIFGVHFGLSFTGLLFDTDQDNDTIHYIANSKPAFQATFDCFTGPKFSFGLHGSIQSFKVDVISWDFRDGNGNFRNVQDLQAKMKRFYIGTRLLYHYRNTEKTDFYTGLRIGYVHINKNYGSKDVGFIKAFDTQFQTINRPSIGIVIFGARFKFKQNFGANIELNQGAPHLFSFGASYMF